MQLNCPAERQQVTEVEDWGFELGFTDNIFDYFLPHELNFSRERIQEFVASLEGTKYQPFFEIAKPHLDDIVSQDLSFIRSTNDPEKIALFKDSGIQRAGLTILPNDNWDKLYLMKIN